VRGWQAEAERPQQQKDDEIGGSRALGGRQIGEVCEGGAAEVEKWRGREYGTWDLR